MACPNSMEMHSFVVACVPFPLPAFPDSHRAFSHSISMELCSYYCCASYLNPFRQLTMILIFSFASIRHLNYSCQMPDDAAVADAVVAAAVEVVEADDGDGDSIANKMGA